MDLATRARAAAIRAFDKAGESARLRTKAGGQLDTTVRIRIVGYQAAALIAGSGIIQGDQQVYLLAADVVVPPEKDDLVLFRGKSASIMAIDDNTGRVAGTLIEYILQVRGK